MSTIESLPVELFEMIFGHLYDGELLRARRLCKSVRNLIDSGFHTREWRLSHRWIDRVIESELRIIPRHYRLRLYVGMNERVNPMILRQHARIVSFRHWQLNGRIEQPIDQLSQHPHLTKIELYSADIGDLGAQKLSHSASLTSMILCRCNVGASGVKALAENSRLVSLGLAGNPFFEGNPDGTTRIQAFEALTRSPSITDLDLDDIEGLGDTEAGILALSHGLKHLSVNQNKIGNQGATALSQNSILVKLCLYGNPVGSEGFRSLILSNSTLRTLWISGNPVIDYQDAEYFAHNTTLKGLNLRDISPEGLYALSKNRSIDFLVLRLGKTGIMRATLPGFQSLLQSDTLRSFHIFAHQLSSDHMKVIQNRSATITRMSLSLDLADEEGFKTWSDCTDRPNSAPSMSIEHRY